MTRPTWLRQLTEVEPRLAQAALPWAQLPADLRHGVLAELDNRRGLASPDAMAKARAVLEAAGEWWVGS